MSQPLCLFQELRPVATSEARNEVPAGDYILRKSGIREMVLVLWKEVDDGNWGQLAFSPAT